MTVAARSSLLLAPVHATIGAHSPASALVDEGFKDVDRADLQRVLGDYTKNAFRSTAIAGTVLSRDLQPANSK